MPPKKPLKTRQERKEAHWARMELMGRVGFLPRSHARIIRARVWPLFPQIERIRSTRKEQEITKILSPAISEIATGFALMATKIKNRVQRRSIRLLMARLAEKNASRDTFEISNRNAQEIIELCGSPEKANEFFSFFVENYNEIMAQMESQCAEYRKTQKK